MSTENEGNPVPPAPSAPPVPPSGSPAPAPHSQAAGPAQGEPLPPRPDTPPARGAEETGAPSAYPADPYADAPHPGAAQQDSASGGYQEAPERRAAVLATSGAPGAPGAHEHTQGAPAPAPTPGLAPPGGDPYAPPHAAVPPPVAAWPPPPPPAVPTYADGGGAGGWGAAYESAEHKPRGGRRGGLLAAVTAAALFAGALGGGVGYWAAERNDESVDSTTVSASDTPAELKREAGTVSNIAATALPSVVTIDAKGGGGEGGTGTGFIYDKQGHILTNNHVVASAAEGGQLSVTFSNGKKYDAEVIGRAQGYDVAVLKMKNAPSDLKPLPLGNSDKVAVGDSTIAIGAPFGLSNTVTTGIVSAKDRPVASSDGGNSKASYMSALQTDASINPGNSGGPLLDARGAVIGVNSAIQSAGSGLGGAGQAGSIGLGFAIPVNQATEVAQTLIRTGQPVYAVIGASVSLQESGGGATITQEGAGGSDPVSPNGPAAKAGLQPGDVITKLDDTVIDSGPTLIGEIWTHQPGDSVRITYERDGKERTANLVLGERKGDSG